MRDPRFDILFEPVQIGPVRAPNRFYQVPHCTGWGHEYPNAQIRHREIKAEGGWGVVCTQVCEVHYSSDHLIRPYDRLWDDSDIPVHARMVDAVHRNGSLAAVELGHSGINSKPFYSRAPAVGPSSVRAVSRHLPWQSKAMDKADIREFRHWHRDAALRARKAGFDIIYVYAAHNASLASHFLSRRYNARTDEYGGRLENRVRLLRELLEDTCDAVGSTCGVALRFAVDEMMGENGLTSSGEGRDVVEMLAELPDLWDVNISPWAEDSRTARLAEEGYQESYVSFVKKLTTKPVVGVGRFTSPDAMVSQIRRGILDFIGAARPSIADPFLPRKIEEGRPEDIRECIGCNVCVSIENYGGTMNCTQNPTIGEEWKRGWHPEKIAPRTSDRKVLVVGAGPAGLECALSLGRRGYDVGLAEAGRQLGGRILKESSLPGLGSWMRVRDYRVQGLEKLPNVEIYRESKMSAEDILSAGFEQIVIATGSHWRRDPATGVTTKTIPGIDHPSVYTPDDILGQARIDGPVLIFDDDHYYMGTTIAELLNKSGTEVIYATPLDQVAAWTTYTMEQFSVQSSLMKKGVQIRVARNLVAIGDGQVELASTHTGEREVFDVHSTIVISSRAPQDELFRHLSARAHEWSDHGIEGVTRIGDCLAPATIAAAVFSGHEFARNFDASVQFAMPFKREQNLLEDAVGWRPQA